MNSLKDLSNKKKLFIAAPLVGVLLLSLYLLTTKDDRPAPESHPEAAAEPSPSDVDQDHAEGIDTRTSEEAPVAVTPEKKKGFFAQLFSKTEKATPQIAAPEMNGQASQGSVTQKAEAPAEQKEVKPIAGCFERKFKHQTIASHSDGEACIHHKNVLTLDDGQINPRSICLKINGTPVKHKVVPGKESTQVVFGPLAGPRSEVTVRYCLGKDTCNENCKIPKDEFMDVIGGGDILDGETQIVAWDPNDAKKPKNAEVELEKELKSLKELLAANQGRDFFKGWIEKGKAPSCDMKISLAK